MQDNKTEREGNTALIRACQDNDIETARILIDGGTDVNEPNSYGNSPLIFACMHGDDGFALVQLLVDRGADVNHANQWGETPLITAVTYDCSLEMFNYLLGRTNDTFLNSFDHGSETVLRIVRDNQNFIYESLLLQRDAREYLPAKIIAANPTVNKRAPVFGQGVPSEEVLPARRLSRAELVRDMAGMDEEMDEEMERLADIKSTISKGKLNKSF